MLEQWTWERIAMLLDNLEDEETAMERAMNAKPGDGDATHMSEEEFVAAQRRTK